MDINYDAGARCPLYDAAVRKVFSSAQDPKAMVRSWNELTGYVIQPRRDVPLILVLSGGGDNGKTVLTTTIIRLLGTELVCAQPVESFEANRFAMGNLFGKLLLVDDDVRAGIRLPDGFLKKISESKIVTGEEKFRQPFTFVARTVPLLLCNNVPSIADLSHGLLRRLQVVPFAKTFLQSEKDPTLFERIWATELPGVLNRAIAGLGRLRGRGSQFKWPVDCALATEKFIREANPLPAFIEERCRRDARGRCLLRDFYDAYVKWADQAGITLRQQQSSVRKNLEHMIFAVKHGNRGAIVTGLALK
jgi:P4 family phage/plasmid primase-like protien